jgi:hypothetical protein
MMWLAICAVLLLFAGGVWVGDAMREGHKHRHEQRLEQLRAEERRVRWLERTKRPPKPVCGCGHHLAKHDRRGRCHEVVQIPTGWDADSRPLGFSPGVCNCQRYVGPQPLSQVYADDLTDQEPLEQPSPGDRLPEAGGEDAPGKAADDGDADDGKGGVEDPGGEEPGGR